MSCFSDSRVFGIGLLAQQRHRHADARQRRAQLVAAVGEQQAMRGDQLLDAPGRAVEALGQRRHLVAALDLHARAEIAAAQLVDAGLQPLEAAAEPAHHGIGADGDGRREQCEKARDPQRRARPFAHLAGDQPAPVGQLQGEGRAVAGSVASLRARDSGSKRGGGRPAMAITLPSRAIQGQIELELAVQRIDRPLVIDIRRVGVGQQRAGQLGGDVEILRRLILGELPRQ